MNKEELTRALKYTEEKHTNDTVDTFDTNISMMCSDVLRVLENCIEITEGATNGDMIKAMFPNCEQKEHIHNGYFEMYFDKDLGNASYMRVSNDWWNAPYKREVEE